MEFVNPSTRSMAPPWNALSERLCLMFSLAQSTLLASKVTGTGLAYGRFETRGRASGAVGSQAEPGTQGERKATGGCMRNPTGRDGREPAIDV